MYESKYKAEQGGVCGITCNVNSAEPRDDTNPDDLAASENSLQFNFGWYLHPIAIDGKYPEYMRSQIDTKSARQGEPPINDNIICVTKPNHNRTTQNVQYYNMKINFLQIQQIGAFCS